MHKAKVRILFLGSRNLAEKILKNLLEHNDECEIIGVVLPSFKGWWVDNLESLVENSRLKLYKELEATYELDYDLILSINYWKLIPEMFINKVNGQVINIHHSYKLKFKGRYSTSWAIMHARKDNCWEHGTTIHYIDKFLDNGPIIATDKVIITEYDTAESLFEKVETLAISLFEENFSKIIYGTNTFVAPSDISYEYDRFSKDNIKFSELTSLIEIYDFVRAWTFTGRPAPSILLPNRKRLVIELEKESN